MKKMVTVKLSSKRCTGMLQVDKGRDERGETSWVKTGAVTEHVSFQAMGKLYHPTQVLHFRKSSGDTRLLFY